MSSIQCLNTVPGTCLQLACLAPYPAHTSNLKWQQMTSENPLSCCRMSRGWCKMSTQKVGASVSVAVTVESQLVAAEAIAIPVSAVTATPLGWRHFYEVIGQKSRLLRVQWEMHFRHHTIISNCVKMQFRINKFANLPRRVWCLTYSARSDKTMSDSSFPSSRAGVRTLRPLHS